MAELALGIAGFAGTVDVCIKFGKYLVQAYKDYGQVDKLADELSVRIRYKALHFLNLRETLESTVVDLEAWQKRFEPSWFQILKTGSTNINNVLKAATQTNTRGRGEPAREGLKFREAFNNSESVKLAEKILENFEIQMIPYCETQLAIKKKDEKYFIIGTVSRDTVALRDARELASRLRDSNPFTFGTLKCKGILQATKAPSLKFVFCVPEGYSKVQSCREFLLSGITPHSLTTRLNIAQQLVTAVHYVHLYEFVHKTITPETILTLASPNEEHKQMLVCLAGFQLFRYADAPTNTSKTEKRSLVYQHPTRIGGKTVKFFMKHDIYSLGVSLLEIGLWRSLVEYDGATARLSPAFTNNEGRLSEPDPQAIKEQLILLSRTELRICMGDIYSKVVETCLTCLDEGNTGFGDPQDFDDQGGVEVGSRCVKKIMNSMAILCF